MKKLLLFLISILLLTSMAQAQWDRARRGNAVTVSHTTVKVDTLEEKTSGHTIVIKSDVTALGNFTLSLAASEALMVNGKLVVIDTARVEMGLRVKGAITAGATATPTTINTTGYIAPYRGLNFGVEADTLAKFQTMLVNTQGLFWKDAVSGQYFHLKLDSLGMSLWRYYSNVGEFNKMFHWGQRSDTYGQIINDDLILQPTDKWPATQPSVQNGDGTTLTLISDLVSQEKFSTDQFVFTLEQAADEGMVKMWDKNNVEAVIIDSVGNIGIRTTTTPGIYANFEALTSTGGYGSGLLLINSTVNKRYNSGSQATDTASVYAYVNDQGNPYLSLTDKVGTTVSFYADGSGNGNFYGSGGLKFYSGASSIFNLNTNKNLYPDSDDAYTFGYYMSNRWKKVYLTDTLNVGGKGQGATIWWGQARKFGDTDSSGVLSMASGNPLIQLNATGGTNVSMTTNSSDQMVFQNANGGYTFDAPITVTSTTQGIIYSSEVWVTSASQNPALVTLPANAKVTQIEVWVSEAFTSDGTDLLTIGYDAAANAYMTDLDVSSTGVKTVTLGTTSKTVDATSRVVEVYYTNGGTEPGAGKAHVSISWIQCTVSP